MIIELADNQTPYAFPFAAFMREEAHDYKRVDAPVIVQRFAGAERHYYRVTMPSGRSRVANDSMLYVIG